MNREAGKFGLEYVLITDSQEIDSISESIGPTLAGASSLFVLVGDGEYTEVWASEHSVPWAWAEYERII